MAHQINKEEFLALPNDKMWELFSKYHSSSTLDELNAKLDIVITKINKLESELEISRRVNTALKSEVLNLKRKVNRDAQYHRQENLEFSGIPESIPDGELEQTAITIFKKAGVDVKSSDIVDCHRLKNRRRVIIRMVNRKHCQQALAGSKRLKGNTSDINNSVIYINRNLIPEYNTLRWKAKLLKQANYIFNYGVNRRGIWVQMEAGGNRKQVEIDDDLMEYLPAGILLSDVCH